MKKLLIANRGEIAHRILRTAKELGIGTVAAHSEADARALHVRLADETVSIGPAPPTDSYLKIEQIVSAAKNMGADAVHPGYGFLSERPDFARACRDAGLIFVGPCTHAIETMATKTASRAAAEAAGLPVLPASGVVSTWESAEKAANALGYPVCVKPLQGGGGIGMQPASNAGELRVALAEARRLASALTDSDAVYLEKLLPNPRHVEIQLAADNHGNVVTLGERECSIQRRYQKLVDETPSPAVDAELRQRMSDAAVRLAQHLEYTCLGTVEFLLQDGEFYFLEMNTRLQVEHTVTEMVTDLDLVEWQLRIAMGEELPAAQDDITMLGHAIQCRVYAEDPFQGFAPSPGRITRFDLPEAPWLRHDVGVTVGDHVTPFYDSLVAKLVAHGPDRQSCVQRLRLALMDYRVHGVATTIPFFRRLAEDTAFVSGNLSTRFIEHRPQLTTA